MKAKILSMAALIAATLTADAQDWSLTGNAGTNGAVNFVGTTDNRPLIFRTNNIERLRLLSGGRMGLGTTSPITRFQVNVNNGDAGLGVQVNNIFRLVSANNGGLAVGGGEQAPDSGLYVNGRTGIGTLVPNSKLHINTGSDEDGLRVQIQGTTRFFVNRNGGASVGSLSIPPANGLFVAGNAGIGTTAPATKLHVLGGSDASLSGGGYAILGSTGGTNLILDDNELIARNNGAVSTFSLNNDGGNVVLGGLSSNGSTKVGISANSPSRELEVEHGTSSGATFGLMIGNEGTNDEDWTMYVQNSDGALQLYENGALRGQFSDVSGAYSALSDRKFKKDIEAAGNVLDKVMQLEVSKYHFTGKTEALKHYGLIAQDVEKVVPEIVTHHKQDDGSDTYLMDYSMFGVLAIKAIQEQQNIIDELKQEIAELKSGKTNSTSNIRTATGMLLEQNMPNPFNNVTNIRFNIPANTNAAQIVITNMNGVTVKTFNALPTGSGSVSVHANELTPGTYYYSLILDGKKSDTKKMILVK